MTAAIHEQLVRILDAERPALPSPDPAPALAPLDARPERPQPPDAQPLVADTPALGRCPFCATQYELGPAVGELFTVYPEAESRYWKHCLIETHQRVMRARHSATTQLLADLPAALSQARSAQKDQQHPLRLALKELLA